MAEGAGGDLMHLTLHLTNACNMRCDYCYAPPPDCGETMSFETARKALELGAKLNGGASCGIVLFGGEPLLAEGLIHEIVDCAAQMQRDGGARFHFKITTNGTLLTPGFVEFSARAGIMTAISFDGVREAHDRHRKFAGGAPSFDVVDRSLRLLVEARPYTSVMTVLNPDTAGLLVESMDYLMELGCRYMIVSMNYAADWTEESFAVLRRQFEELGERYVRWTKEGRKFYFSPFEVKMSSHINCHNYKKERCELSARQISIGPDGSLYPCVQFAKAGRESFWRIGSVESGIDEARRERVRAMSERGKPSCEGCAVEARCNNSCGCLNWQTTGSVEEVSPVLCRYEQMLMPIADRAAERLYKERDPLFLHKHYNAAYPAISLLEDVYAEPRRPSRK